VTNTFDIRTLTDADIDAILEIDESAFGSDISREYFEEYNRPNWDLDRFIGAFDPALDGELVGVAASYAMDMTFPGAGIHPVAGVTWVGVRPGQQRRGILTALMRHQLDDLHERSAEAVALLTASESAIYSRYGYGPAIDRVRMEGLAGKAFRPGVLVEPVRQVGRAVAMPAVRELYEQLAATTTGFLQRPDSVWHSLLSDHELDRDGATKLLFGIHPQGFVAYRVKQEWGDRAPASQLFVQDICATTPVAWASLWRHVLDYPLISDVAYRRGWLDDPLPDLLLDSRSVRRNVTDHVWARLVDLDRAVPLRTYRVPASVVVGVTDGFCPWNAGTWRLDLDTDGGTAVRTDEAAQVTMDTTDLAAAFLGGQRLHRLVTAGRVRGDAATIETLALALSTPCAPWTPEGF